MLVFFILLMLFRYVLPNDFVIKFKEKMYPFQNTSLPWDERVDDLVARLTLQEIQLQLARGGTGDYGGPAPAIPRLGIGPYAWNTECLRGDVDAAGNATAFAQAIGLAATFSPTLIARVAAATGQEVRGKHNDFVRLGIFTTHTGASCFSPVINIVRDSRWGRIQETYGEDPFMSGVLAQNFVTGLQGSDSRFIQASAGCKHFNVHGGPENIPVSRFSFDAKVSEVDWRMTFLPAFRACVKAGTLSLMCSYNRINGVPACANKELLTDITRGEWNFKGYVISDQGAIENIQDEHHYTNNTIDTAAAAVGAGCNLELSNNLPKPVYMSIVDAVKEGKLSESLVRDTVKPLFYTRMRLGEFDPPDNNPYAQLDSSTAESTEHQALALESAIKSLVLLKNNNNILPLKKEKYNNVAILGPMSDNVQQQFGDYAPFTDHSFIKTPLQGIREIFPNAKYSKVCMDGTRCTSYKKDLIPLIVNNSDLIIFALGTGPDIESEGQDRADLELPGYQKDLLRDGLLYSGNSSVVMLLFNAGPLNVSAADDNNRIEAIIECFFPAQAAGEAIRNVLTNAGGNSSPAGRLPLTWPYYYDQLPPMTNYSMEGRTYRYIKFDPLYPFGYGLSYTTFNYSRFQYLPSIHANETLLVWLTVSNVGNVDSDEVVQCYISWGDKTLPVPVRQLVFFDRVHIKAGQSMDMDIAILGETMAFWDNGHWVIKEGLMTLYCGGQQPFQKKSAPSNILSGQFIIKNTLIAKVL
ncbi:xylan 1,4-beta-xylosidase-like isoform X2 [Physella acuta]|uniref:xylan 1,4-beta-xylosidase-like isoform X2 n=1 Tax=Physella acuta TaxID=109671 RepID=UPI0027DD53ED|nr:xylan 1,4-beta-xylosidase-like isoform X2 [Physella acuta]